MVGEIANPRIALVSVLGLVDIDSPDIKRMTTKEVVVPTNKSIARTINIFLELGHRLLIPIPV